MKVLWFTNIMLPEFAAAIGAEKKNINGWLSSLARAVRKYAPEVELVIASEGPYTTEKTIDGIKYISLGNYKYNRLLGIPSNALARAVKNCVERERADLIHVHGTEGVFAAMPTLVWGTTCRVVSIQGIILGYSAHFMGGLHEDELAKHRPFLRKILRLTTISDIAQIWRVCRGGFGERHCFTTFNHYLGRTDWDRAWVEYLHPSAHYHEVGEILRPEFWDVDRYDEEIVRHSIYCSAAMTYPLKGGHWLLRAVASLRTKYPDIKLTIAAGENIVPEKGLRSMLRRSEYANLLWVEIQRLGLQDCVRLMPSLTAREVANELSHTEIFVLPSLIENSPNSLGEAMLSGVPCVATYVGGIPSILENGKEGLLVPSGDPAFLALAIDHMFSDREFACKCAKNAYETAVKRYHPQTVVRQLLTAYQDVLK